LIVSLIWAMAKNRVIGLDNRLPWKLPADMKWFRQHTLGKTVIMGRSTFESFGSKPLPDRTNIVISRDKNYHAAGSMIMDSLEAALEEVKGEREIMVIGGMSLYKQTLPLADKLYMTVVDCECEGDAWFPEFELNDWTETLHLTHEADDKNSYRCEFFILERKQQIGH